MGPKIWVPSQGSGSKTRVLSGQPQITLVDFSGQTGANYVTGGTGLSFVIYSATSSGQWGVWYNTGTETAPTYTINNSFIEVAISPLSSASEIATSTANSLPTNLWRSIQDGTACEITDLLNQIVSNAYDVNTGAAITTVQEGSA